MRRLFFAVPVLAGFILSIGSASSTAAPDPINCTGYPEPRIQLENQSWWEPQSANQLQGHIHVGACFPLYQHVSGATLQLDVTVKLHNMQGTLPSKLRVTGYNDWTWEGPLVPPCSTADCQYTYALNVPLTLAHYSGPRVLGIYLNVTNSLSQVQRNFTRFLVYLDNGLPPAPVGSSGTVQVDPGGDSWYSVVQGGITGQYAQAQIVRADIPWDEATGELRPVSGIWTPTARYEARRNFAYVDPAFHAMPPSKGTTIYEAEGPHQGYLVQPLTIDTRLLTNGLHRLVIGSGNVADNGVNTGVLVVPFLVNNPDSCQ